MVVEFADSQDRGDSVVEIFREFAFEAAHSLPAVPEGHKCRQVHGHSYRITVHVEGDVGDESGWVLDFGELKDLFEPLKHQLDHKYLNDIEGLANPTSENLASWIWNRMKSDLPGLTQVVVRETTTSGCVYRGNG